jgi:hypothetical protein
VAEEVPNQAGPGTPTQFTRFGSLAAKIIGGVGAAVTVLSTLYAVLFSPDTDLLRLLALAAVLLGVIAIGVGAALLIMKKSVPVPGSESQVVTPAFSAEDRASARKLLVPFAAVFFLVAMVLFAADYELTPRIADITLPEGDSEVLHIHGTGFGHDASRIRVKFAQESQEEFVATAAQPDAVEVAVPPKFLKGNITVRRGPRSSPPKFFAYPGVVYEAAVVELILPTIDPIAAILNQLEPYPGFPYYSDTSDKPTQWPPRVGKDRTAFHGLVEQQLSGAAGAELASWVKHSKPTLQIIGGDEGELDLEQNYARLRSLLTTNHGDFAKIGSIVGPQCAKALATLEAARRKLASNLPNRALILRVRNRQIQDVENFTAEFKVGGSVYDVAVNEEGEKARSLEWSPDRINVDIARLRPGYMVDIEIWYNYLPPERRVFVDAADIEWAKTQGVVIGNLGISNAQLRRSPSLLTDLNAYHRFPIDPVKGSPTFGKLIALASAPNTLHAGPANAAPPDALKKDPADPATAATKTPSVAGPQAIVIAMQSLVDFQQKNDALEAQLRLKKAMDDFSSALSDATSKSNGYWIFQNPTPISIRYSNFTGKYGVEGGQLAIVRTDGGIDVTKLSGWQEMQRAGAAKADYIPWDKLRYEVVLHFFSDPRDSKGDSKRLLTRALRLDQIFDLDQAKVGKRNAMSASFGDLLRFSRARLAAHYHAPFTLNNVTEQQKPFYIVVRGEQVSENFYLPAEWMPVAEKPAMRSTKDSDLSGELSRLYDYGDGSRELSQAEFQSIFGP